MVVNSVAHKFSLRPAKQFQALDTKARSKKSALCAAGRSLPPRSSAWRVAHRVGTAAGSFEPGFFTRHAENCRAPHR